MNRRAALPALRRRFSAFVAAVLSAVLIVQTAVSDVAAATLWADRVRFPAAPLPLMPMTPSLAPRVSLAAALEKDLLFRSPFPAGAHPVVLIEDIHGHPEAQRRISDAIRSSASIEKPAFVALEGASGGFLFDAFAHFPAPELLRAACDAFLADGSIAGPAHAGFSTGSAGLVFAGIETPALYRANVAAYRQTRARRTDTLKALAEERADLLREKAGRLNARLAAADNAFSDFEAGRLSFIDFLSSAPELGLSLGKDAQAVVSLARMERTLDRAALERERRSALAALAPRLTPAEAASLLALGASSAQGGALDYVRAVEHLASAHRVALAHWPTFARYAALVDQAEGIDMDALLAEVPRLEDEAASRLARTPEEAALFRRGRALSLAIKLVQFALTSAEWERWKSSAERPRTDVASFEAFYRSADDRSEAMADNFIAAWRAARTDGPAFLVAGGFHTPGLQAALARRGVSAVIATPRVTRAGESALSALSVFDREKSLIESWLSGRRLFLAGIVDGSLTPPLEDAVDHTDEIALSVAARAAADGVDVASWTRAALERRGAANPAVRERTDSGRGEIRVRTASGDLIAQSAAGAPLRVWGARFVGARRVAGETVSLWARGSLAGFFRAWPPAHPFRRILSAVTAALNAARRAIFSAFAPRPIRWAGAVAAALAFAVADPSATRLVAQEAAKQETATVYFDPAFTPDERLYLDMMLAGAQRSMPEFNRFLGDGRFWLDIRRSVDVKADMIRSVQHAENATQEIERVKRLGRIDAFTSPPVIDKEGKIGIFLYVGVPVFEMGPGEASSIGVHEGAHIGKQYYPMALRALAASRGNHDAFIRAVEAELMSITHGDLEAGAFQEEKSALGRLIADPEFRRIAPGVVEEMKQLLPSIDQRIAESLGGDVPLELLEATYQWNESKIVARLNQARELNRLAAVHLIDHREGTYTTVIGYVRSITLRDGTIQVDMDLLPKDDAVRAYEVVLREKLGADYERRSSEFKDAQGLFHVNTAPVPLELRADPKTGRARFSVLNIDAVPLSFTPTPAPASWIVPVAVGSGALVVAVGLGLAWRSRRKRAAVGRAAPKPAAAAPQAPGKKRVKKDRRDRKNKRGNGKDPARSLENRFWLALLWGMVAADVVPLFTIQTIACHAPLAVWSVEAVVFAVSVFWSGYFARQYRGLDRAFAREETIAPIIPALRGLRYHDDPHGPAAVVRHREIVLNPTLFDRRTGRSRLSEAEQESLVAEERRHLLYQQIKNIDPYVRRTPTSLLFEEIAVNTWMMVADLWLRKSGLEQLITLPDESRSGDALFDTKADPRMVLQTRPADEQIALLEQANTRLRSFLRGEMQGEALPVGIAISDQHGSIDKFDALLSDAFRRALPDVFPADWEIQTLSADKTRFLTIAEQLPPGVTLEALRGRIHIHNIGDFMDRGDDGIKILWRSMELIQAGLSDFVPGNHDFWMMMNLLGYHLPWYHGFDFHGYRDRYDRRPIRRFLWWMRAGFRVRWNGEPVAPFHTNIATIVRHYQDIDPQTLTKEWWAARFAEATADYDAAQTKYWSPIVDEPFNGPKDQDGNYARAGSRWEAVNGIVKNLTAEQADLIGQFLGHNFRTKTDVYTGVRAVEHMSVEWWRDQSRKMKRELRAMRRTDAYRADPNAPQFQIWREAIRTIDTHILPEVTHRLDQRLKAGQWWIRAFEAVNYNNYTSAEWWSKDWVFHAGWGTSVLKEINKMIASGLLPAQDEATPANYLASEPLRIAARFFQEHFNLYTRDAYGNTYMHAFLPVDMETGDFYFEYQGVKYRGDGTHGYPSVWEGLDRIGEHIRRGRSLSGLSEAFRLVNSWYADNTTQAKAPNLAAAIGKFGIEGLGKRNGFTRLFTGHIPFHEFSKIDAAKRARITGQFTIEMPIDESTSDDEPAVYAKGFVDGGMGKKFKSRGVYFLFSTVHGAQYYGFEEQGQKNIVSNPRVVEKEKILFESSPGIDAVQLAKGALRDNETYAAWLQREREIVPQAARSLCNRLGLMAVFVALTALALGTGVDVHSWWIGVRLLVAVPSIVLIFFFLDQALEIRHAERRLEKGDWGEVFPGIATDLDEGIAELAALPDGTVARVEGRKILYNDAYFRRVGNVGARSRYLSVLSQPAQYSMYREEHRHLRRGKSGFIEEILINVVLPVLEWEGHRRQRARRAKEKEAEAPQPPLRNTPPGGAPSNWPTLTLDLPLASNWREEHGSQAGAEALGRLQELFFGDLESVVPSRTFSIVDQDGATLFAGEADWSYGDDDSMVVDLYQRPTTAADRGQRQHVGAVVAQMNGRRLDISVRAARHRNADAVLNALFPYLEEAGVINFKEFGDELQSATVERRISNVRFESGDSARSILNRLALAVPFAAALWLVAGPSEGHAAIDALRSLVSLGLLTGAAHFVVQALVIWAARFAPADQALIPEWRDAIDAGSAAVRDLGGWNTVALASAGRVTLNDRYFVRGADGRVRSRLSEAAQRSLWAEESRHARQAPRPDRGLLRNVWSAFVDEWNANVEEPISDIFQSAFRRLRVLIAPMAPAIAGAAAGVPAPARDAESPLPPVVGDRWAVDEGHRWIEARLQAAAAEPAPVRRDVAALLALVASEPAAVTDVAQSMSDVTVYHVHERGGPSIDRSEVADVGRLAAAVAARSERPLDLIVAVHGRVDTGDLARLAQAGAPAGRRLLVVPVDDGLRPGLGAPYSYERLLERAARLPNADARAIRALLAGASDAHLVTFTRVPGLFTAGEALRSLWLLVTEREGMWVPVEAGAAFEALRRARRSA